MTTAAGATRLGATGPKLTTVDCVAQSMAVGPIFSGAVLGSALAGLSGGVGPITIVFTMIGVLSIGYVVSELAKLRSGSGTVYEFVAHTLGKRAAVYSAGLYHLAIYLLAGAGIWIAAGVFGRLFFPGSPPWWVWALGLGAIAVIANILGIEMSVRAQLVVIVVSVIPFLIMAIAIVSERGAAGNSMRSFHPGNAAEGGSVMKGLLFAILMFVGFELAAALGEETEHPQRSIPVAVLTTVALTGAFYVLTQYIGTVGSGGEGEKAIPFDFPALADRYVGSWLGTLTKIVIVLDLVGVAIGFTAACTRGMYTLARDGLLPAPLARLNRRSSPANAAWAFGVGNVVVLLVALLKYGTTETDGVADALSGFLIAATYGGMLIAIIYGLLCAGGLGHFAKRRHPLGVIASVVGLATAIGGVAAQFVEGTAPVGDALWGRHLALAAVVLVAVWLGYSIVRRPEAVEAAGKYVIEHEHA